MICRDGREWLALGFIKIMPGDCPNLLEEAQRYRYDTDPRHSRSELPVDEYNHDMAALRYLVMGCPVRRDECKGRRPRRLRRNKQRRFGPGNDICGKLRLSGGRKV